MIPTTLLTTILQGNDSVSAQMCMLHSTMHSIHRGLPVPWRAVVHAGPCLLLLRCGSLPPTAVGVDPSEWGTGAACLTCSCVMQWMDLARRMLWPAAWVAAVLPPTIPC